MRWKHLPSNTSKRACEHMSACGTHTRTRAGRTHQRTRTHARTHSSQTARHRARAARGDAGGSRRVRRARGPNLRVEPEAGGLPWGPGSGGEPAHFHFRRARPPLAACGPATGRLGGASERLPPGTARLQGRSGRALESPHSESRARPTERRTSPAPMQRPRKSGRSTDGRRARRCRAGDAVVWP